MYGSGSLYHQAKIVRKTLNPTVFNSVADPRQFVVDPDQDPLDRRVFAIDVQGGTFTSFF
jgi:hypothetical protein